MGALITRSFFPQTRRRFLRITPRMLLWMLGGIGLLCLLASGWRGPVGASPSLLPPVPSPVLSSLPSPLSSTATRSWQGAGAGGQATLPSQPAIALDICLPGDTDCFMHAIGTSLAQQMSQAAEPVVKGILDNPVDLFFQTPAALTYQNAAVIAIWNALMAVVAIALACLIVLGGYNVVVAPYFGLPQSSIGEFLPRLLLAFGAAHFSLNLLGSFIELENAFRMYARGPAGHRAASLAGVMWSIHQREAPPLKWHEWSALWGWKPPSSAKPPPDSLSDRPTCAGERFHALPPPVLPSGERMETTRALEQNREQYSTWTCTP